MARHQRPRRRSRANLVLVALSALALVALLVVVVVRVTGSGDPTAAPHTPPLTEIDPGTASLPAVDVLSSSASPSPSPSPSPTPVVDAALQRLVRTPPPGRSGTSADDASVAALDLTTGRGITAGARGGMTVASVGKVQVLETVLLARQRVHRTLSEDEVDDLTAMIEHSDNTAADRSFRSITLAGAGPDSSTEAADDASRQAAVRLGATLGLSSPSTVQGDGILWGLTTSGAAQQITLLKNLLSAASPLDANARTFALGLMSQVESDQRWGVGEVDDSTITAMKDGWLPVGTDDGLWADNSVGILRVRGHVVLLAVLTQHNDTDEDGRERVAALAQAATTAVLRR